MVELYNISKILVRAIQYCNNVKKLDIPFLIKIEFEGKLKLLKLSIYF